jgi:catechol 2,3-dioxygenase-like lactoylglutathione lyase family enzyme
MRLNLPEREGHMNILHLDHAALLVQDVNRSRQFYMTILGLYEIASNGNCWLTNGLAQIHLLESESSQNFAKYCNEDLAKGHTTHLAFEVEDLEEARLHLKANNVPIVCGPRPRWPGGRQLYFCDLAGYVIEFFQKT